MSKMLRWLGAGPRFPFDQPGVVSLALAGALIILGLELGLLLL